MPIFDGVTQESIKQEILDAYEGTLDTREGSFVDLLISPLAWELYKAYMDLQAVPSMIYPDETSGLYLDADGARLGIYRRAGTQAEATVTLNGTDGLTVPAGTAFLTEDGREYRLAEDVTLTGGTARGTLRALEEGAAYNTPAGTILRLSSALPGLTGFQAGEAAGGTDVESNQSLYDRINYYRQHPSSSGNVSDYYTWALSVEGVGSAYVIPLRDGPGTVAVLLSGPDGGTVDEGVVSAVKAYIETQRPVGATVSVESCTEQEIAVSAQIKKSADADLEAIKSALTEALSDYLTSVGISGGTLSYNRAAYILLSIPGVEDFAELTLDGGTEPVPLAPGVSAKLGEVTVTEAAS